MLVRDLCHPEANLLLLCCCVVALLSCYVRVVIDSHCLLLLSEIRFVLGMNVQQHMPAARLF